MEKKYEWKDHLIFMGCSLGWLWVNRGSRSGAFIWMTVFLVLLRGAELFCSMFFPWEVPGSVFFTILAAWLEMAVVETAWPGLYPSISMLNAALAWHSVFYCSQAFRCKGHWLSLQALCFIQSYGLLSDRPGSGPEMETMALWMAVAVLWCLYRYINGEGRQSSLRACIL